MSFETTGALSFRYWARALDLAARGVFAPVLHLAVRNGRLSNPAHRQGALRAADVS
jgi:hypothetical protein